MFRVWMYKIYNVLWYMAYQILYLNIIRCELSNRYIQYITYCHVYFYFIAYWPGR